MLTILSMGGQELNILAAEEIMGWTMGEEAWLDAQGREARRITDWYPSTMLEDAFEVQRKVLETGLGPAYLEALRKVVRSEAPRQVPESGEELLALACLEAKPRCRAALLAVCGGAGRGGSL